MKTHSSTGPTKSLVAAIGLTAVVAVGFHGASAANTAQDSANFQQMPPAAASVKLP